MTESLLGIIAGLFIFIILACIIAYALTALGCWKVFTKAGEAGWKGLIPIYNTYVLYDIAGCSKSFWYYFGLTLGASFLNGMSNGFLQNEYYMVSIFISLASLACSISAIVIGIKWVSKLAKAFNKGTGFAVGLFLFTNIFLIIMGFDDSVYTKPTEEK